MTRLHWLAGAATLIAASAAVIDFRSGGAPPRTRPVAVLPAVISAPGLVEGLTEDVVLLPEVTGVVAERLVDVGDQVDRGQALLRLDDRKARLAVRTAEAAHSSAEAQLERLLNGARSYEREEARALREATFARLNQAETTLERLTQLERQSVVAAQEADDARANVENLTAQLAAADARLASVEAPAREDEVRLAKARVDAAQAEVEIAQLALEKTQLVSPLAGRVLDVDAQVGELISPSHGPVVVLADTSRLRVRAYVEELDAPRVVAGSVAEVAADGLPGERFTGRVASVSPRMAAKSLLTGQPSELYDTKVREVLIDLGQSPGLIVGLRVDVWVRPPDEVAGLPNPDDAKLH